MCHSRAVVRKNTLVPQFENVCWAKPYEIYSVQNEHDCQLKNIKKNNFRLISLFLVNFNRANMPIFIKKSRNGVRDFSPYSFVCTVV